MSDVICLSTLHFANFPLEMQCSEKTLVSKKGRKNKNGDSVYLHGEGRKGYFVFFASQIGL